MNSAGRHGEREPADPGGQEHRAPDATVEQRAEEELDVRADGREQEPLLIGIEGQPLDLGGGARGLPREDEVHEGRHQRCR